MFGLSRSRKAFETLSGLLAGCRDSSRALATPPAGLSEPLTVALRAIAEREARLQSELDALRALPEQLAQTRAALAAQQAETAQVRAEAERAGRDADAARDEAAQARAQADALKAEMAQRDLAQSALTEGTWTYDIVDGDPDHPDNRVRWSDQLRGLLGVSRSEFPDTWDSWLAVLHPDDKTRVIDAFNAHLTDSSGRTPYVCEYRLRHRTRGYVWFRERAATVRDANGRALQSAGALRDISDEKQAQELQRD